MDNVVLIGMPGSGKSTLGVVLAKLLGYGFIDSDLIIEEVTQGKIKFGRRKLYVVMIRFVVPFMLLVLLLQAVGLF